MQQQRPRQPNASGYAGRQLLINGART